MSQDFNRFHSSQHASDILRIGVTLPGRETGEGPVRFSGEVTRDSLEMLRPRDRDYSRAIEMMEKMDFEVSSRGQFSFSVRCSKKHFERVFGTRLTIHKLARRKGEERQTNAFYYPKVDAPWKPDGELMSIIDDAYIQWPHIYMNNAFPGPTSALPPTVKYHHLRVPGDVTMLLGADFAHRQGITGKGIRVAMIDTGFAMDHAYFLERGYNTNVVLAAGAAEVDLDNNGHGTAESANLLAMAPDVEFTGVKLDNDRDPGRGASILEGLHKAMESNPQIISVSMGYDLCHRGPGSGNSHYAQLPNSLKALEAEVRAIAGTNTIVVFAAGNGHVSFPGMMPDVISAGGVYVDQRGHMQASDYASAFVSKIYPGRAVPDASGLVGLARNGASYIMLPLQPDCKIDRGTSDGTGRDDGWAVISGTSAAAPQMAGGIALLLQKNPGLTADEIRSLFDQTSKDVVRGRANAASNENNGGMAAAPGKDPATGAGLINIHEALKLV